MSRLNEDGYTILECVLCLLLIGLSLNIISPNFKSISRFEEEKSIKKFERDLYRYRNQSILDGMQYNFKLDEVQNDYTIYRLEYGEKQVEKVKFHNGIKIMDNSFKSDGLIVFNPTGAATSGTLKFKSSDGKIRRISIEVGNSKINVRDE